MLLDVSLNIARALAAIYAMWSALYYARRNNLPMVLIHVLVWLLVVVVPFVIADAYPGVLPSFVVPR